MHLALESLEIGGSHRFSFKSISFSFFNTAICSQIRIRKKNYAELAVTKKGTQILKGQFIWILEIF
jgi:hypothetical protein